MDKEKEIEELAVEIAKINCKSEGCENCDCAYEYGTKADSCEDYLHYYGMARTLYTAGYRKADEVRKETAKEIVDGLLSECDGSPYDCVEPIYILHLAKKYGVEV